MIFTNVIKPTHLCNLGCRYCYNEDVRKDIMSEEVLLRTINQTFEHSRSVGNHIAIDFIWHGGEPLLAGLDFFRKAVLAQQQEAGCVRYSNSIQTNGVLIDADWISFFKNHNFRVSISIDGPRIFNDMTRVDQAKAGSFDRTIAAIHKVKEAGISLGVAVVISKANCGHIEELYDFLVREHLPFNIIPLNYAGSARDNYDDLSINTREFAESWIKLYDRWFDGAGDSYIYCSDFAFKTRAILKGMPTDCISQRNCSLFHISTSPNGEIHPCATLSSDKNWSYGNVMDAPLHMLLQSKVAILAQSRAVDPECGRCRWQNVCNGGCMARAVRFYNDHNRRDFYCQSFKRIFKHIEDRLRDEPDLNLYNLHS